MPESLIGRTLGQYQIRSLIGQGGMASVYLAHHSTMKRDVAIKIVTHNYTEDATFRDRFNREVETISSLEHAHITPVYEHGVTEDGFAFLTMRYLRGGTLADVIAKGPMPLEEVNTYLKQVADALDYAHNKGIIHRDIKPSNIMLDEQNRVYLADFGLARVNDPDEGPGITKTGAFLGTPTYISPEQINQEAIDSRADLYSLGVVLYEMVTGRPPYMGDSVFRLMQAHISEAPPPARTLRPELTAAMETVLNKALEKERANRYQTAEELARAFDAALQSKVVTQAIESKRAPAEPTQPVVAKRSPVPLFAGIGVVLVLVLAASTLLLPRIGAAVQPTRAPVERPERGTLADLTPAQGEIDTAKTALNGSFIGIMACSLGSEYHTSLVRSMRTRAASFGLPVKLEEAGGQAFRQPAIVNSFVAQGAKAILACPIDDNVLKDSVDAARKAGVYIVNISDTYYGDNSVAFSVTNETMGRAVGEYAAQYIRENLDGKAVIAILQYATSTATIIRADNMEAAVRESVPDAVFVGRWNGGTAEEGRANTLTILEQHPEVNVILSINDAGSFGAVEALREKGIAPDAVSIFSVDGEAEARRLINNGEYFRYTFYNSPNEAGEGAVDAAVKMLAGSAVPKIIDLQGQGITRE